MTVQFKDYYDILGNYSGIAVVLDLLERIDELETRVRELEPPAAGI